MLRQVLDAAHVSGAADHESTLLAQSVEAADPNARGYGSVVSSETIEEEQDDKESEEYDEESYQSTNMSQEEDDVEQTFFQRRWRALKDLFVLILNVDNLWDEGTGMGGAHVLTQRNHLVVLFWFFLLAMAYACERSTFYLVADRTGPFRLFSAEMITGSHALILVFGMFVSALSRRDFHIGALGIPLVDVAVMALLDAGALVLALISGFHVPPTLTVILIQFTIPLAIFFTQLVHPDGRFRCQQNDDFHDAPSLGQSDEEDPYLTTTFVGRPLPGWGGYAKEHLWGASLTTAAVFLGLIPAFMTLVNPELFAYADAIPLRTAYNSFVFTFACVPAAASQLFKEHVFLQHKQPVDAVYLNLVLSVLQFSFILMVSPLVYTLQGLGAEGNWTALYPSIQVSSNFNDGLKCFFGLLSEEQAHEQYAERAICERLLPIVLSHVLSIILVGLSVDKIVHAGATKVMYRGISAGIIIAVISMLIYDYWDPDFNYGTKVDFLHFICTVLIILGSEIYHRASLPDATFETVYPELGDLYDDDV